MQPASLDFPSSPTPHYTTTLINCQINNTRNRQDGLPLRMYSSLPSPSPSSPLQPPSHSHPNQQPPKNHTKQHTPNSLPFQKIKTNNTGQNPRPHYSLPRPLLLNLHKRLQHPQARLNSSLLHRPRRLPTRSHHRPAYNRPAAQYPRLCLGGCQCGEYQPE